MPKLSDLQPDSRNANKGTPRGTALLEKSLREYGAGRSILIDRNGVVIAGNKTLESAAGIGLDDLLIVQTDGTKLVAVQRTDLDLNDPKAVALAIADNRVGQVSLEWDTDVLSELLGEGIPLLEFWHEDELSELLDNPTFEPVGADEQGRLDEKATCTCPNCGHEFTP